MQRLEAFENSSPNSNEGQVEIISVDMTEEEEEAEEEESAVKDKEDGEF